MITRHYGSERDEFSEVLDSSLSGIRFLVVLVLYSWP